MSAPSASRTSSTSTAPLTAGTTLIGKLGVESTYEHRLHGNNGSREVLVNAQGRSVQRQGAYAPNLSVAAAGGGR